MIVSRVSFPLDTQLAWHWHPGEEFLYVVEESVTLKRRGQADQVLQAGDAQKIDAGGFILGSLALRVPSW